MLRLTISRWSKLGTRVPRHFFSASVLLLAATIVALAATTDLPDAINRVPYHKQLNFSLTFSPVTPITARVTSGALPGGLTLSMV
jgi:hypothetical protein